MFFKKFIFFLLIFGAMNAYALPTLHDSKGQPISHAMQGKWLIINYWAPWCHTCLEEIPELNYFYQHNQNKNVLLLGVDYDQPDLATLQKVISSFKINYPVLLEDPKDIYKLDDVEAIPTTFVINPKGKVVKVILGPTTADALFSYTK